MDLIAWYDGENVQSQLAGDLKDLLIGLKLKPGMAVEDYINTFKNLMNKLNLLKGHRMTDHNYKRYFVKNIEDPAFAATKHDLNRTLGSKKFKMELMDMIEELHQEDQRQRRKERHGIKRPRLTTEVEDDGSDSNDSLAAKKIRMLEKKIDAMTKFQAKGTHDEPVEKILISEMPKDPDTGIIYINPNIWGKLKRDLKDFVRRHNAATKHKDPLPNVPTGVTLIAKKRQMVPMPPETSEPSPINPIETKAVLVSTDMDKLDDAGVIIPEKGISFGLGSTRPLVSPSGGDTGTKRRKIQGKDVHKEILIFDTGGGSTPTVTNGAWTILADTGVTAAFQGYGPGTLITNCRVVHAVTKAHIRGMDRPILLKVHHALLLESKDEEESLLTLLDMVKSGVTVNGVTPSEYLPTGADTQSCGITVDGTYFPFDYDDEKLYFRIEKPSKEELDDDHLDMYNINGADITQLGVQIGTNRRAIKEHKWNKIPTVEWTKRLGLAPTDVIERILQATTQHYLEVEVESRGDPQRHWAKRFKSLQYERQNQSDVTDTIFQLVKLAQGHTCSQFFVCVESKLWHITPMRREQYNHLALQEHLRKNGIPQVLISDNATSETSSQWSKTCRKFHIQQKTSEPYHPHQNSAEPEIGRLSRMVRQNMQAHSSPLQYNNWCQLYCCQVNNITAR